MKTEPERYEVGPFRFKMRRDGGVAWRYKVVLLGGTKIDARGRAFTMEPVLRNFLAGRDPEGLRRFVRHHMGDLPEAINHAERIPRGAGLNGMMALPPRSIASRRLAISSAT